MFVNQTLWDKEIPAVIYKHPVTLKTFKIKETLNFVDLISFKPYIPYKHFFLIVRVATKRMGIDFKKWILSYQSLKEKETWL